MDPTVVAAEIAELKSAHPVGNYYFFHEGNFFDGREPDELLMICVDTSLSMATIDTEFGNGLARVFP